MSTVKSCPTPADKNIKNNHRGKVIQPVFDDCGVTGTTIKYYTRMQECWLAIKVEMLSKNNFLSFQKKKTQQS